MKNTTGKFWIELTSEDEFSVVRFATRILFQAAVFRFDMSDLQPAAFGATAGQGEWKLFQDFVANPGDVKGVQAKLESAAAKAYK